MSLGLDRQLGAPQIDGLFRRLGRAAAGMLSRQPSGFAESGGDATLHALAATFDLLLGVAEMGGFAVATGLEDRLTEQAAALANLGLEPLAAVLQRAIEPGAGLDRVLIAVHVARLQAALRRLPLLAPA